MIGIIISGGQTGVDRAALDMAIRQGIPYGGWCPKGRLDENGSIPDKYSNLREVDGDFANEHENYSERTLRKIQDSDGTLILVPSLPLPEKIKDGTLLTIEGVKNYKKPCCIISLNDSTDFNSFNIIQWIVDNKIKILNVAGPRESCSPGIYHLSIGILLHSYSKILQNDEI